MRRTRRIRPSSSEVRRLSSGIVIWPLGREMRTIRARRNQEASGLLSRGLGRDSKSIKSKVTDSNLETLDLLFSDNISPPTYMILVLVDVFSLNIDNNPIHPSYRHSSFHCRYEKIRSHLVPLQPILEMNHLNGTTTST